MLYADDTLLIGLDASDVEELTSAVEIVGGRFGLKLHWGKTQALSVCTNIGIKSSDGTLIPKAGSVGYLGGLISEDGRFDSELSRKSAQQRETSNNFALYGIMQKCQRRTNYATWTLL